MNDEGEARLALPVVPPRQLAQLATPFPESLVENRPGAGDYVAHHVVVQRLLAAVGPFSWARVAAIRGDVAGAAPDPRGSSARARAGTPDLVGVVVGAVWRLSVTVDGRDVTVEEVGEVDAPHNWPHDGAREKAAASDALKRAAMRLGLGLHLWSQGSYFLDRQLLKDHFQGKEGREGK